MLENNSNFGNKSKNENIKTNILSEPAMFIKEMSTLTGHSDPLPHNQILSQLIKKIKPIDFREYGKIPEDTKLRDYHFQIISVEYLLDLAFQNQWGLCQKHAFIYLFNGSYWSQLEIDEIKNFLGQACERMGVNRFKARHHKFRDELLKQFITLSNLQKPSSLTNPILVNLKNGIFEILPTSTKLREVRMQDFITYALPFSYDPAAQAPKFKEYLNKVLPDIEKQNILAEYLGYIFIPTNVLKLEKSLFLFGEGANGKSVFYDIVYNLIGPENISSYSLKSLTDPKSYSRAELANKLLNYASEIGDRMEADTFKQLASGEPIEARVIYQKPFIMTHYAKLLFNCNNMPRIAEHSKAINRRIIIIHFDVTLTESEQDKQLAQKIIENELSGIFNWVLQGLNRLMNQKKFSECESAQLSLVEYEKQSDSIALFIEDRKLIQSPSNYILIKDLYLDYRTFCNDDGYKPVHKINFIKRLKGINILIEKRNIGNVAYLSKGDNM